MRIRPSALYVTSLVWAPPIVVLIAGGGDEIKKIYMTWAALTVSYIVYRLFFGQRKSPDRESVHSKANDYKSSQHLIVNAVSLAITALTYIAFFLCIFLLSSEANGRQLRFARLNLIAAAFAASLFALCVFLKSQGRPVLGFLYATLHMTMVFALLASYWVLNDWLGNLLAGLVVLVTAASLNATLWRYKLLWAPRRDPYT